MKCFWLVSVFLLHPFALPLLAEETLDADHAYVKIDPLPAGWQGGDAAPGVFFAMKSVGEDIQMFQVNSSSHSSDFKHFCDYYIPFSTGGVDFKDMKTTTPTPAKVGPPGTLEFDITGKSGDTPRHIHVYLMSVRKTYAVIKCTCDQADWETTRPEFDQIANAAK